MGYTTVEVHEVATNLYGYHNDMRNDKANIIVRRKFVGSAANDLGFVRNENGTYSAVISAFDSNKHNAGWMLNLKKSYTEHTGLKEAKRQGLKLLKTVMVNGCKQHQFIKV